MKNQDIPSRKPFSIKNLLALVFIVSLGLNAYHLFFKKSGSAAKITHEDAVAQTLETETVETASVSNTAVDSEKITRGAPSSAKLAGVKRAAFSSPEIHDGKKIQYLYLKIENTLNHSVCRALPGKDCEVMGAYVTRILVWFLDVKSHLRNGDTLSVVYMPLDSEEKFKILKLTYASGYSNKTYEVNFYKGPDMKYGAYFNNDGIEVAPRIDDDQTPIKDYLEITSLPGDFRAGKNHGHSGTDFKADVGTPIYSAFEGKVLRVNWNFRMNGDCIEIDHPREGVKTLYLHLNKVLVKPGMTVKQGQQIAESGNTGRSFAPHLHYEIQGRSEKKVIYNPFKAKFHRTYYKKIPDRDRADYEKMVQVYDSILEKS
ncbi:MAG: M23 family metallopeptidase [Nitrospinae bacterium]|nr:M23 family metallopeptidase [Nitrospinota bacterium]